MNDHGPVVIYGEREHRRAVHRCARMNRLRALLAVELRTEWRYSVPAALLGLAAVWSVLLALLPTGLARAAAPYLLFVETMTVGTLFAGALMVTARTTGVLAALRVTPVRAWEYVTARLVPLTVLTAAGAVPVLLAARLPGRLAQAVPATALAGLLLLGLATGVAARRATVMSFLLTLPWPVVPLLAIPLAVAAGLLDGPVWYGIPTTGALAVLAGAPPFPVAVLLGYLAFWAAGAAWFAACSLRRARPVTGGPRALRRASRPRRLGPLRADLRQVTRDSMPVLLLLSPLLLGVALRVGFPFLAEWSRTAYGVELTPYVPALALVAVVLHVPVAFGMTGALLVLDDLEDGILTVVATSPLGIPRYVAHRAGAVTMASAAGLAIAAPLSGMVPGSAWGALVLAVALGPVFMLAMLALAGDRVRGVAAAKVLGLPAYLPVLAWFTGPLGLLFAPFPGFWIVRAWDASEPPSIAAGMLVAVAWCTLLARCTLARLRAAI